MIKLRKGVEPDVLVRNAVRWTSVVTEKIHAGERPTKTERIRYNHAEIREELLKETGNKCAYCESKFRHVTYGDIEHVVPKSDHPTKWFDWNNLTIACDVCNTNKSDAPVDGESFVDPYEVDPEDHFWQLGSMICAKPGSNAAALTERLLELNRPDLLERRFERLTGLLSMLDSMERCDQPELKRIMWQDFLSEAEPDREYAALSRALVAVAKEKLGYE